MQRFVKIKNNDRPSDIIALSDQQVRGIHVLNEMCTFMEGDIELSLHVEHDILILMLELMSGGAVDRLKSMTFECLQKLYRASDYLDVPEVQRLVAQTIARTMNAMSLVDLENALCILSC
jgi:hypothetical protein